MVRAALIGHLNQDHDQADQLLANAWNTDHEAHIQQWNTSREAKKHEVKHLQLEQQQMERRQGTDYETKKLRRSTEESRRKN